MKKLLGVIPLLAYLLATLVLGGTAFIFLSVFNSENFGGDSLGEALFGIFVGMGANILILPMILMACIPLLMFIFKLIHLISGARFCGIFCVLIDVLVTVALFVAAFSDPHGGGGIAVLAAAELGCCLCNMASLAG